MSDYVTDYMRQELSEHALELVSDGDMKLYRMGRSDTGVYAIHVAEFAGRLCVAGDICLGANGHGLVSAAGYGIRWFAGQLSEAYLCEKFLRREWQWDAAVESIRSLLGDDAAQGEGWWLERAVAIEAFLADPGWRHDEPSWAEFCERMAELGHDGCELPGHDYPRVQAGWLCAIQQRFRALHAAPRRPPGFWRRWCLGKGL
jgi:hypothetical protein